MEGAASLFKVFDLAFFLPGSLLLVAGWQADLLSKVPIRHAEAHAGEVTITVVAAVVFSFLSGVCCHFITRLISLVICLVRDGKKAVSSSWDAWYKKKLDEGALGIAQYFWYMRATFANLAVATFVAAWLWLRDPFGTWMALGIGAAAAAICLLLSIEYGRSLKNLTGL